MEMNSINIIGRSISGHGTCLVIPEYSVALDIGYPVPEALGCSTVLITHTHVDHIAAIAWHGFTRNLQGDKRSLYLVPPESLRTVRRLLEAFEDANNSEFNYEVQPLHPGDSVRLNETQRPGRNLYVQAFKTDHRGVPSQGYSFLQEKPKLKQEYRGLPGREIAKLRKEGAEVLETKTDLEVVYTGDTRPIWGKHPEFRKTTRAVITECTFLEDQTPESVDRKGHTSLRQIKESYKDNTLPPGDKLLLTHFSMRYSRVQVEEACGGYRTLTEGLSVT